ncbi:MAG: MBL fold metallo-hydrolase [Archaeoglobus sp.]|nr:MBL fold metallo-hydrolase [Archaeoglobus sp.]
MKLTVVYDNEKISPELETGWGFSCFIDTEERILFDTGWDGSLLLRNLQRLGIQPKSIDAVVLSHSHWDHAGGLSSLLLDVNDRLRVYVLPSFSKNLKREIGKRAEVIEVEKGMQIAKNCFTTGELGRSIKEQSMLLKTVHGILIVTGCSHPGVEEILREAEGYGNVYGIIGGFHDFRNLGVIKNLKLVVPCHCTTKKREIEEFDFAKKCGAGIELHFETP